MSKKTDATVVGAVDRMPPPTGLGESATVFRGAFEEWGKNSKSCSLYIGSSTVAFQVYEILKIDHEFLQFF